jgi:hypothetical protein
MDVANAPSVRRVRVAALLAVAALPLVVALPASAAPYTLPGIGHEGRLQNRSVVPAPRHGQPDIGGHEGHWRSTW